MSRRSRNLPIEEALSEVGCPICAITLHEVAQSIERINYDLVNDPDFRQEFETAWGFCSLHAALWLQQAHPLGTAIFYDAVLGRISDKLSGMAGSTQSKLIGRMKFGLNNGGTELTPSGYCPLCRIRDRQEILVVDQLLQELDTNETFRQRYLGSHGMCIPHLHLALCRQPSKAAAELLRQHAQESQRVYRQQLQEIIRKHDYRFRDESFEQERGAIENSVVHVAGKVGAVNPHFVRTSTKG